MVASDIITKAKSYVGTYVYWYGGKGEKCTTALLSTLSKLYPNVYTTAYKALCNSDIREGKHCIDCSGLVCACYNVPMVGTAQFDKYFKTYTGEIKNGMIVWRTGHTGIYYHGYVIEARGKMYGVTQNRKYKASEWTKVYYKEGVDYGMAKKRTAKEYLTCAQNVIIGAYGTGEIRKAAVNSDGYDYEIVQQIVNLAVKGGNK